MGKICFGAWLKLLFLSQARFYRFEPGSDSHLRAWLNSLSLNLAQIPDFEPGSIRQFRARHHSYKPDPIKKARHPNQHLTPNNQFTSSTS